MDKYTIILKVDEIRRLAESKQYEKAMKILDTIDINKIKIVTDLSVFADVFEHNKRYDEAIDILMRIYVKSKTRRVIYQLAKIYAKSSDFMEAEKYYKEFLEIAPKDTNRFILRYKLDRAEKKPIDDLIKDLTELKRNDYMEEWAYELAKLYHKAGNKEKCIQECRDIILWFGDGIIVEKAKLLKEYYLGAHVADKVNGTVKKTKSDAKSNIIEFEKALGKSLAAQIKGSFQGKEDIHTIKQENMVETHSEPEENYHEKFSKKSEFSLKQAIDKEEEKNKKTKEALRLEEELNFGKAQDSEAGEALEKLDLGVSQNFEEKQVQEQNLEGAQELEETQNLREEKISAEGSNLGGDQDSAEGPKLEEAEDSARGPKLEEEDLAEGLNKEEDQSTAEGLNLEEEQDLAEGLNLEEEPDLRESQNFEDMQKLEEKQKFLNNKNPERKQHQQVEQKSKDDQTMEKNYNLQDGMNLKEEQDLAETQNAADYQYLKKCQNLEEAQPPKDLGEEEEQNPKEVSYFEEFQETDPNRQSEEEPESEITPEEKIEIENYLNELRLREQKVRNMVSSIPKEDIIINQVNLNKALKNFMSIPTVYSQLEKMFCKMKLEDNYKHSIISGFPVSGKTYLAKLIARSLYQMKYIDSPKVAVITGEKLNNVNLEEKQDKLIGGCVIIQRAGELNTKTVDDLICMMKLLEGNIIIILEDNQNDMKRLLLSNRKLAECIPYSIELPQYRPSELEGFAVNYFAKEKSELDPDSYAKLKIVIQKIIDKTKPEDRLASLIRTTSAARESAEERNVWKMLHSEKKEKYEDNGLLSIKAEDLRFIS